MATRSIAIDGPAGAGKSTLAKSLAKELGFLYVDTGAIYRTVGLYAEWRGADVGNPREVIPLLKEIRLHMAHEDDGIQHMYLQGEDVTEEIRQNRVSYYASQVSAMPEVRAFLLEMQRSLAREHNVVMDGRDIGTVVLPDADLKIFLTASARRRAMRRYEELAAQGNQVPFEQVLEEILVRDEADRTREISPLRQAEDAVLLDTSDLNLEESLQALRTLVKEAFHL